MVEHLKAQNRFFYLREVNPAASPIVTRGGRRMIMLGSNNYLGLTDHPEVKAAATKAVDEFGTGCAGSRVLTGTTSLHTELEEALAQFKTCEALTTFSAGYMTMLGTVWAITAQGDLIFSDELNHASIIDGCRLSGASVKVYHHSDMGHLEELLASVPVEAPKLIVTDGVFSMEGDVCRLPEIIELGRRYRARIMVDDAHATGVLGERGRGTAEHFGLEGKVDVVAGTFSKTFGSIGGFVGSNKNVVSYLQLNARPFIFSAALPPVAVATVRAALKVLIEQPSFVGRLRDNARFMSQGLTEIGYRVKFHDTPIIPVLINDEDKTFRLAGELESEGVFANPVVP
ncbi:MAG: aminotransferase class I/II-fold pyridoxal phosphate-dependent enzyme, partial [candidate division WOR-3 bacterium]